MNAARSLTIGIVAGESSGDYLGAKLIAELRLLVPGVEFVGVPGPQMRSLGCQSWFNMESLSVMGLVEVLAHLPRLLSMRRSLIQRFTALRPDIFIGIDAPDFNLDLELALKLQGIPTVHYVSPTIWAWRPQRIAKIAQATDLVLSILPFEKPIYDRHKVPCRFVGHPLADEMPLEPARLALRRSLGISDDVRCLALLPGSRKSEVERLAPQFLKAAQLLQKRHQDILTIVPLVNQERRAQFTLLHSRLAPDLPVMLLDGQAREAMSAANLAMLASGTATLECMLAKCPMVVGYRLHPVTFWLAKRMVKSDFIALPNLLAAQALVPELLQESCTPERLVSELGNLISGGQEGLKNHFTLLHQRMRGNASRQAAEALLELI